jgi:uncharacterized protein YkwD
MRLLCPILLLPLTLLAPASGIPDALLELIEDTRAAQDLAPLARHSGLERVALERARSIAAQPADDRLSPELPLRALLREDEELAHRNVVELVDLQRAIEQPAESAWRAWQHHPPSWEVVIEPQVEAIGIASHTADDGTLVLVALFLQAQRLPTDLRTLELRTEEMINEARERNGLKPLRPREGIRRVAREHSADMAERDFFDHVAPDGRSPGDRADDAGLGYLAVAENIGVSLEMEDPVAAVVDGWLQSPGHYANLMNPRFRHTGVGIAVSRERGRVYFTQLFVLPGRGGR